MKSLLSFIFLQLIGIYLFTQGYLLSRIELPDISNTNFTIQPKFKQTILILIDALRYDFVAFQKVQGEVPHFANKLGIIHEKLSNEPENCILLRGMSDPPTTTLQRLIAIMTGALPTLVDATNNFASSALGEDNLLHKLLVDGKRVVSIGDDTWDKLFPASMNESYFYPSFDVWDLHSVDIEVKKHLFPVIKKNDFGLLIAHFLGVDHAGHRYGPGHVAMGDKLVEMNSVLDQVFKSINEETLVIVMGDHGMDTKGDHGGDSFPEMDAALFFYAKKRILLNSRTQFIQRVFSELQSIPGYDIFTYIEGARTVQQIDLVSTVSYLMGVDVPFGNLGMGITELLADTNEQMIEYIRNNARQVYTYIEKYSTIRHDIGNSFAEPQILFKDAEAAYSNIHEYTDDETLKIYFKYAKYLRQVLLIARNIWSRFDNVLIAMGIFVSIMNSILVLFYYFNGLHNVLLSIGVGLVIANFGYLRPISIWAHPGKDWSMLIISSKHEVLFFFSIGYFLTAIVTQKWKVEKIGGSAAFNFFLTFSYIATMGSDSFLIFEDHVLFHFIQFTHLMKICNQWVSGKEREIRKQILVLLIVRLIFTISVCRPDQGPYCIPTFYTSPNESIAPKWSPILSIILGSIIIYLICKNGIFSEKYCLVFILTLFSGVSYWTFDTFEAFELVANAEPFKNVSLYTHWASTAVLLSSFNKKTLPLISYSILILYQKPMGQITFHLLMLYILIEHYQVIDGAKSTLQLDIWVYVGLLGFFATGHQNQLASVQYDVGFIGLTEASYILSPLYITLNTVGATLILCTVPLNSLLYKHRIVTIFLGLTSATLFTGHFARHSQAFRVWGPKFLFYGLNSAAMVIGMIFEYLARDPKIKVE